MVEYISKTAGNQRETDEKPSKPAKNNKKTAELHRKTRKKREMRVTYKLAIAK